MKMAESFEPEEYHGYSDQEPKRKDDHDNENQEGEESALAQKVKDQMRELLAEKILIDENKVPHAIKLLDQEIIKIQQSGRPIPKDYKYVDIYREKPIKLAVKVLVPVREHPKFNFVGKLLGPKGNSLKRLQEDTMCRMAILGRGSMKDRNREEELRKSLEPKYAHLCDELHVEISTFAPPAEAYARLAFALAEVRKYLVPDSNDNIRQEQLKELEHLGGLPSPTERPVEKRKIIRTAPPRPAPTPPPMRGPPRGPPGSSRSVMPAKTKIMSILDKARSAMEESYGYDEEPYERPNPRYGSASGYQPKPNPHHYSYDYEEDYYKEGGSYSGDPSPSWKNKPAPRHTEGRYRTSPYSRPK